MEFVRETFSRDGLFTLLRLLVLYLFIEVFRSLFDQTGSLGFPLFSAAGEAEKEL
jgi:POT family proton-dependent oligopeptide transporter